jgi:hypothetical protein
MLNTSEVSATGRLPHLLLEGVQPAAERVELADGQLVDVAGGVVQDVAEVT